MSCGRRSMNNNVIAATSTHYVDALMSDNTLSFHFVLLCLLGRIVTLFSLVTKTCFNIP